MTRRLLLFAALTLLSAPALADDAPAVAAEAETHIPVSVSVVPGVSVNGFVSSNVVNNFSLGLIGTHAGRIDGVALAPVLNWVGRGTRGALLSGALNVDAGRTTGAQLAGAMNLAREGLTGWQAAGALNIAGGPSTGWQAAGAVNIANGGFTGLQTAGGLSFADRLRGAQISVVNIGGDVEGTQIGVINIAGKVRGLQLGVVNIANELEGAPIGVVSIARNGQLHLQAFSSDLAVTNAALKFGSKHVYTFLTAGYQPGENRRFVTGLGLGGHIPLNDFYVDVDVVGGSLRERFIGEGGNVLGQLRVIGGYRVAKHFAVFAGATANVWTLINDPDWEQVGILPGWQVTSGTTEVRMWPGLLAGIEI